MSDKLKNVLAAAGQMVIDGSMATALEQMGADLNCNLWTARALVDSPELVKQVHINYFKSGADCGITCSYQATIQGLMNNGFSHDEAAAAITESVRIFKEARDEWWAAEGRAQGRVWPLCLGAVGPYGAFLADGSEYKGAYGVSDKKLYDFHRERMQLLWNAGADLLLIETQPSLHEALIEADIAEELGADYWISFSCKDGHHINEGNTISECAQVLSRNHPGLKMLGVNCSKPEHIVSLIHDIKAVTDIPVGVYPNSGETYDPITKTWHGNASSLSFEDYALSYFKAGADAVGGCCTTTCSHIEQVVKAKEKFRASGCAVTMTAR